MDITYVRGDATRPEGAGPRIIVHICNDIGGWGRGFVLALSRRWREPEQQYRAWFREGLAATPPFALGQVQFVPIEQKVWVANLLGQHGVRGTNGHPPIRYEAVREGLSRVARFAQEQGAAIHMPRIGIGLAGGTWSEVSRVIKEELIDSNIPVTVYDLPSSDTQNEDV